jgi:predicted amidohydrolase YtcJ
VSQPSVDLVLTGGRLWSAGGLPESATALAVADGRIVAVGSDHEIEALAGPRSERVDLSGGSLLPGFVDAHTHFIDGGLQLSRVSLRTTSTREAFSEEVAQWVARTAPGRWILGGDWDHELWGGRLPSREWIDGETRHNPVAVTRLDLHTMLLNSRALEVAGIDEDTPDPPGGAIVRDLQGRPTGILKDEAMRLAWAVIPKRTPEEVEAALERAARHALSLGVTQVHDMANWAHLEAFRRARRQGRLPLRVYSAVRMAEIGELAELVRSEGRGDDRLWWGGLKGFVDGSLGSKTAWFHDPYSDDPESSGLIVTDLEELGGRIAEGDRLGLQCIVHAIGDRANDWLLDQYESVARRNGPRERRFRIEHAQHLTASAIPRFGELGVIASVQPYHAADDGRWAEKRIGPERVRTTYAFGSLHREGATLAFGSDWTVAPLDPLKGIEAAVTRALIDGSCPNGWVPEERVSLDTALTAYTYGGAFAGFGETFAGSLRVGSLADLVLLSDDIFDVPPEELDRVTVDRTWVGGTMAYRRDAP